MRLICMRSICRTAGATWSLSAALATLEAMFVTTRDLLAKRKQPTFEQRLTLCAFMAAAQARTSTQMDHLAEQWGKVLGDMERMKRWAETATPKQRLTASSLAQGSGPSFEYEDAKRTAEKPMETWLMPQIETATPLLTRLDFAVVECAQRAELHHVRHPVRLVRSGMAHTATLLPGTRPDLPEHRDHSGGVAAPADHAQPAGAVRLFRRRRAWDRRIQSADAFPVLGVLRGQHECAESHLVRRWR
jgi:hypothetical protein